MNCWRVPTLCWPLTRVHLLRVLWSQSHDCHMTIIHSHFLQVLTRGSLWCSSYWRMCAGKKCHMTWAPIFTSHFMFSRPWKLVAGCRCCMLVSVSLQEIISSFLRPLSPKSKLGKMRKKCMKCGMGWLMVQTLESKRSEQTKKEEKTYCCIPCCT